MRTFQLGSIILLATGPEFVGVVLPESHFSAVSATDPRTTVTRSIKSKANKKKSESKTLNFDPQCAPIQREIGP